jgi:predicted metalloprotease with PDZ domain
VARLAERFVCVRIQSMNGVNINLFQFEGDLTWMAFFMDAHDRFYARYGGREDSAAESHLTRESLLRVMEEVLVLHGQGKVQTSRYEPTVHPVLTPEDIPPMKGMMAGRKENKCIHCHDVKVAMLRDLQAKGLFSRDRVFTYPAPSAVGIELDPHVQNQVDAVIAGSAAEKAGLAPGDRVLEVDGQRILTLADFARVLEPYWAGAELPVELLRGEETVRTTLELSGRSWRRGKDPSWRESLHVAGPNAGFWGQKVTSQKRQENKLSENALAVQVTHIWGDHTRKAGLKNGDVVIAFDNLRQDMTIQQLHAHLQLNKNYGDTIAIVVRRNGKDHDIKLRLPTEAPQTD